MRLLEFEQGKVIADRNDKVKCWYLIQKGAVFQRIGTSEIRLEANSIIGFTGRDTFLCDYIAAEDTILLPLNCDSPAALKKTLAGKEQIRNIFLRTALIQRHNLLSLYYKLLGRANEFQGLIEALYMEYKTICGKYKIDFQPFSRMELFEPLVMQHRAETWEVNNSISIVTNYLQEYIQLMSRDDGLTVGIIMEAAAQMRRFAMGIGELEAFLSYNKDILLSEDGTDLLHLYSDLAFELYNKKYPVEPAEEKIEEILKAAEKLDIYNPRMITRRRNEFNENDYSNASAENASSRTEMDIIGTNGVSHILEYAGYKDAEIDELSELIEGYFKLPDMMGTDKETYALRKKVSAAFYDIYTKVFLRAVGDESTLTPLLEMFLNFGFMDARFTGEERTKELYHLCAHLDICHSKHIYTIYEWLKQVYSGAKETSKNEYDTNFPASQNELLKENKITKEEMEANLKNPQMRVEFEIHNMFASTNRLTYGRITTFCPILHGNDLINPIEKMLVTAERLENAVNEVRKIDYSIFYREVAFSDPKCGIQNDRLIREVQPDIILMPNAGVKSMMWQETSDKRSDTPGRFIFPLFTTADLSDMVLLTMGHFRWEICRKIEGMRWNDLREKSLTAEYFNYLQFYKKNNDLSPDAKEKVKTVLQSSKNSYREVFAKDYINWIKFEAHGSYRLNKIARDILASHCPFAKRVRDELRDNPFYQNAIARYEGELAKKQRHYVSVLNKYINTDGKYIMELKNTVLYYEM